MKKSSCELFAKYFSSGFKADDFYSRIIANWVFDGVLSYTASMLNIVTIHAIRKKFFVAKDFQNIAPESCSF